MQKFVNPGVFVPLRLCVKFLWPMHISGSNLPTLPSNERDTMKLELIFAVAIGVLGNAFGQTTNVPPADYEANKTTAEQFYSDASFSKAHDIYAKVDTSAL